MLLRNLFFSTTITLAALGSISPRLRAVEQPRSWAPDQFLPLTEERIAALPEAEQVVWRKYLAVSREQAKQVPPAVVPEFSPMEPLKEPLKGASYAKGLKANAEAAWYATTEARTQADHVVEWQSGAGGWSKSNNYSISPRESKAKADAWSAGTFDNNATIVELRFLARVIAEARGEKRAEAWKASFQRGLRYIFNAQYPNGGFPQIYPLAGGYHDAVTFNDNAMVRVLELLGDVAAGRPDFAFVPAEQRAEASRRFSLGVECILKTQIVEESGRRTAWCQQHDMLTLKPCAARNFEPISVCTGESSRLVEFLMHLPKQTPEVSKAVNDAVAWLEKVAIHDEILDKSSLPRHLVEEKGAEPLWARMYEIGTDKPIFGDRDRTIHYALGEISAERQKGYGWYGNWPASVLKEYRKPQGKQKLK